jgi:hypothetical protein
VPRLTAISAPACIVAACALGSAIWGVALVAGCSTPPVLTSPPDPQTGCYVTEHSCGPGLGCCDNDTEMCCGLPESVGCNVPGACLFIATGPFAEARDGGARIRAQRRP